MNDSQLHVVFGAGQVGTPLAARLAERGYRVRSVRRSGEARDGVELRLGDAADPAFAAEAAHGATAVYHCMNPAYDAATWERELPRLADSLISASARAGARLVVLDNLYMLGNPGGRAMNEETPPNPCSRKGEIRAKVAERYFDAHRRGDVRVVSGRASDFYGPGGVATYFGAAFWPRVLNGRSAQVLSDPDVPHTWHFLGDVVDALAELGTADDNVTGRWWMLPAQPAVSIRDLVRRFGESLGCPIPIDRIPLLVLRGMGLFVPLFREILEMRYQFAEPFLVDDALYRARFTPTLADPVDAARRTVDWALRLYRRRF
jgi:nucleoside-diphosphate-sugar epimerase